MSTIYDLTNEQRDLLDALYWDEDNEAIKARLSGIRGEIEHKLQFLSGVLAEAKMNAHGKREAARLQAKRAQQAENVEERLREFILNTMTAFGIQEVKGNLCDIGMSSVKVLVLPDNFDVMSLPVQFRTDPQPEPRKREIMAYLKDGNEIEGAYIFNKPAIRMK